MDHGKTSNPYMWITILIVQEEIPQSVIPPGGTTGLHGGFGFQIDIIYFEYKRHYIQHI